MANCLNYNCNDDLGDHIPVDCGEYPLGGIDAAIILACDHQVTDVSNGTQINAEIAAGRAWLVENIKVSIPDPSPITITNPVACRVDRLVNYDRSGTWQDANVNADNIDFYNILLSGQSFGGLILRECDENRVTFVDSEVTFQGGRLIPDNNDNFQMFNATFNWREKTDADIFNEPANVFTV